VAAALVVDTVIPVAVVDSAAEVPAVGCGSSSCCAVAAEMATDSSAADVAVIMAVAAVDLTTPACGSFSCCAAAVDLVPITVAADAVTPVAVVIPAGAKSESGVSSQGPVLCPGCQIF